MFGSESFSGQLANYPTTTSFKTSHQRRFNNEHGFTYEIKVPGFVSTAVSQNGGRPAAIPSQQFRRPNRLLASLQGLGAGPMEWRPR